MKAIVVEKIGDFIVSDVPAPTAAPDEALLKVSVTGLCRTDLKLIRVGHRDLVLPRIPGEEVVGVIEATGSAVNGFTVGQRVYVYPGKSCGVCEACRKGAENLCASMEIMGFHRDGGFAEYVAAPAKSLIPVPDGVSDEEAVFAEPLSCCLNALENARLSEGETVGIWGAGPAGSLLARAAKVRGAAADVIDPDPRRASRIGGMTAAPDRRFDVCVIAVCDEAAYREALARLKPRGRLVVFSGLAPERSSLLVDFNQLHYFEQTLVGAYGCARRHGEEALSLIASSAVPVADLISHRMPLADLAPALDMVAARTSMKIHLYNQW